MSLHNNSYLVSSHQSEMRRHAAEQRLVAAERHIPVTPTTTDLPGPTSSPVRRFLVQTIGALRPTRRTGLTPRP